MQSEFIIFSKNENGSFKKLAVRGYYENNAFYLAKGSFSVFNTCNVCIFNAVKSIYVDKLKELLDLSACDPDGYRG